MYATLTQTKEYLRQLNETIDDVLIASNLKSAQNIIDIYGGWDFIPRRRTILHNCPVSSVENVGTFGGYYEQTPQIFRDQRELRLVEPLLELESVTNGDATSIAVSDLIIEPSHVYPKSVLIIKKSAGVVWELDDDGETRQVISLVGLWGFHEQYEQDAWVDSLDTVQDNPLLIGATTLTVSGADELAGDGEGDRFHPGIVIKIDDGTDYEFLYITDVTLGVGADDDALTVTRGYRGTVAKEWPQTTPIYVYRPPYGVRQATMEIARLIYRRKDLDSGDQKQIIGTGIKITPTTIPGYIREMLPEPRAFL